MTNPREERSRNVDTYFQDPCLTPASRFLKRNPYKHVKAGNEVVLKTWSVGHSHTVPGWHPPGRLRARWPALGPPRAGRAPGRHAPRSAAATPRIPSASPDPAFPCTGPPVGAQAHVSAVGPPLPARDPCLRAAPSGGPGQWCLLLECQGKA